MTPDPEERAAQRLEQAEQRARRRVEQAQARAARQLDQAAERTERLIDRAAERTTRRQERAEERVEERASRSRLRRIDRSALQGLAHPLRVQLYDALVVNGPATASELGRTLGESSGATSYHLRQLERHGFVETDPSRGTGRERWWRASREDTQLRREDFAGDPAATEAHRLVSSEWQRTRQARYEQWRATMATWPVEWRDTGGDTTSHFQLDVVEATRLFEELQGVLMRWAEDLRDREPDRDAAYRPVEVQMTIFPNGSPPETPPADPPEDPLQIPPEIP